LSQGHELSRTNRFDFFNSWIHGFRRARQMTRKDGWTAGMTGRDEQGRQVKCLTADAGHIWMPDYDRLPSVVRRRLAESRHNICAACMAIEAGAIAQRDQAAAAGNTGSRNQPRPWGGPRTAARELHCKQAGTLAKARRALPNHRSMLAWTLSGAVCARNADRLDDVGPSSD
jgi:hypothetical protein